MYMIILVYTCSAEAPGVNRDFFKLHALGLEYDAIIFYDTDVCLCSIIRTRSGIVDCLLWLISVLFMKAGPETLASTYCAFHTRGHGSISAAGNPVRSLGMVRWGSM